MLTKNEKIVYENLSSSSLQSFLGDVLSELGLTIEEYRIAQNSLIEKGLLKVVCDRIYTTTPVEIVKHKRKSLGKKC